jgi:Cu(I)/Ag(I) efflux system protein CusF
MKNVLLMMLVAALAAPVAAQQPHGHGVQPPALADGEVRRVNKDAKKITIKHGPISNLDMPAHTMVFQVSDPAMLERVKPGDRVRFEAQKVGGAYLLVTLEKMP